MQDAPKLLLPHDMTPQMVHTAPGYAGADSYQAETKVLWEDRTLQYTKCQEKYQPKQCIQP